MSRIQPIAVPPARQLLRVEIMFTQRARITSDMCAAVGLARGEEDRRVMNVGLKLVVVLQRLGDSTMCNISEIPHRYCSVAVKRRG